jgi:hypothetical protein
MRLTTFGALHSNKLIEIGSVVFETKYFVASFPIHRFALELQRRFLLDAVMYPIGA